MSADYTLHTLPNGLKVAHKRVTGTRLVHCGFIIGAGSRDDDKHPGVAHCLEHMLFKGTEKRKTIHVLNHLEVVGGEMNAFTTKEITAIYASVQSTHYARAVDILADVTFNSSLLEQELLKEKKVIADEINMYLDTPEENIYDEFQEQVFGNHPIAHNILGNKDSIEKITTSHIRRFVNKHYSPANMVFAVVGNISLSRALYQVEKYTAHIPAGAAYHATEKTAFEYNPLSVVTETDFTSAYTILGLPAYEESHAGRWPMLLLNNLLGGPGMNSRLNLAIREKYGYTYQIESGYQAYSDAGLFHCYLSCDPKYLRRSTDLILKELEKLKTNKLGTLQMSRVKNQFKGQIVMADENRSGLLIHIGKGILRHGRALSIQEVIGKIDAITAEDLMQTANEVFDVSKFSYLTYVPE